MLEFGIQRDPNSGQETWSVPLSGQPLLDHPLLNKGTAFDESERRSLGLFGLLPPHIDTLQTQLDRAYEEYGAKDSDIERHIFLRALQDENEILFYRLLDEHLVEMLPIVYTPVVGEACRRFSHIYRRPRGLFIAYPERDRIDEILANAAYRDIEVIVVTDGERILGLGDQGTGGMGIPIGKLSLYTLCGGIHPTKTLPLLLDAGTDNAELLADPLYMGWRHPRIRGQEYADFIEAFVRAVIRRFPNVLLQWEDFAQINAGPLLERYRNELCTFNDDIQGTAAVTTGTILSAAKAAGSRPKDQRIVVFGAGSAGSGVAELVCQAMIRDGLSEAEARARCYLVDRPGLLREGLDGMLPFQRRFAQPLDGLSGWSLSPSGAFGLFDVVKNVRPTILIGTSGVPGAFGEAVVRLMAGQVERPIILPLSNPTSRCEAVPADLLEWTEGRALIATGSPYADVNYRGRTVPITQCNNSYIFPGLGLGVLAVGARRVADSMFMAAALALAETSADQSAADQRLLPPLTDIRKVSRRIALAVANEAIRSGLATRGSEADAECLIDQRMWMPIYPRLIPA